MSDVPPRPRAAVTAIFLLNGLLFGAWAARIPAIRDRLDLSDGELGLALAFLPSARILAMPLAGGFAARVGSRRATRPRSACVHGDRRRRARAVAPRLRLPRLRPRGRDGLLRRGDERARRDRRAPLRAPDPLGLPRRVLARRAAGAAFGALAPGPGSTCACTSRPRRVRRRRLVWSRRFLPASADASAAQDPRVRPPAAAPVGARRARLRVPAHRGRRRPTGAASTSRTSSAPGPGFAALGFTAFSVTMTLGRIFGDRLVHRARDHPPRADRRPRRGPRVRPRTRRVARSPRIAASPVSARGCPRLCRSSSAPPAACRGSRRRRAVGRDERRLPRLRRRAARDRRDRRAHRPAARTRRPRRARRSVAALAPGRRARGPSLSRRAWPPAPRR